MCFENFDKTEVGLLIQVFCRRYEVKGTELATWKLFWDTVMEFSALADHKFHVRVVVACFLRLEDSLKTFPLSEEEAIGSLHQSPFLRNLKRCFAVNDEVIMNLGLEDRETLTSTPLGSPPFDLRRATLHEEFCPSRSS